MRRRMCCFMCLSCVLGCNGAHESTDANGQRENGPAYDDPVVIVNLFLDSKPENPSTVIRRTLKDLDVPVRFSLKNNSKTDFHYYGMGRYGPTKDSIQGCPIRLYKGDVLIPHIIEIEGAGLFPRHKRVLKPGEEIPYEVALDSYGVDHKPDTLTEGQYKLRIEYLVKPGGPLAELRCTPVELDRTIMIIELERP